VSHLETLEAEETPKEILKDEGSEVPDVRKVVDGGPARIHSDLPRFEWDERLDFSAEGVEETEGHGRLSSSKGVSAVSG
jgi:hypothetical protein